jgi:hypothetical protein
MIIFVWCVFSKLLRPNWISKCIVKTGCNSVTVGYAFKHRWLFCHYCRHIPLAVGEKRSSPSDYQ